jgi:hypothetical protein
MATSKKAIALRDDIAEELSQRQSALTVAKSFDTDENPLITLGDNGAGDPGCIIKVMPISQPLAKDILGLTQNVYTPHMLLINFEKDSTPGDVNTTAQKLLPLAVVLARAARVVLVESTNGTAPNVTDIANTAKWAATFEPSAQWGMLSSQ